MSIREIGTDRQGRTVYLVQVSAGTAPDGKRSRPSARVHGTRRDAERLERQLRADAEASAVSSGMLFADWAARYLDDARARGLAASTLAGYRRMLTNRILPALGRYPLNELAPRHLAAFYRSLAGAKNMRDGGEALSGHSQLKHHRLIHAMLREAQYAGLLRENPAAVVRAPRMTRTTEGPHYAEDDVAVLLTALDRQQLRYQVPVLLMMGAGLRRGEVIGLRWEDVLLDRGFVLVRHAAEWVDGRQRLKAPKSRHSQASVPISGELVEVLRRWQDEQAALDGRTEYVCTVAGGAWMTVDHLSHWYADFARAAGLPATGCHALRHTYAALLAGSVSLEALRRLMRHHSATVTLANYSHLYTDYDDAARAGVSRAMASKLASKNASAAQSKRDREDRPDSS